MSIAIMYKNANYGGTSRSLVGYPSDRYVIGTFQNLFAGFNDQVSSVRLFDTSGFPVNNSFILFENAGFEGRFDTLFYNQNRDYPYYYNFNDLASSALIVQHQSNISLTVSMQALANAFGFSQEIISALQGIQVPSWLSSIFQGVLLWGTPKFQFTIDKQGFFGQDLIRVEIPLRFVLTDPLPDETVYFYLWLKISTQNGHLQVDIVSYDITHLGFYFFLRSLLLDQFKGSISKIEAELNKAASGISAEGVYTMPWMPNASSNLTINALTDFYGSTTNEDVAIFIF